MQYFVTMMIIFVCIQAQASNITRFTGVAYSLDDGEILYTEKHTQFLNDENNIVRSKVLYEDENGNEFATKNLEFSNAITIPNMRFNDSRTGTSIALVADNDTASLKYDSKESTIDKNIDIEGTTVVDAGFDQLLLNKWDSLIEGETLHFNFLAPTRGELIKFRVIKKNMDDKNLYLILQPDNWLLRVLVDDINLKYSLETKRILEFKGLTNIEEFIDGKVTDKYIKAKILYEY